MTLSLEMLDRATGEDKVAISDGVLAVASVALKLLMVPLGYLLHLNKSMALGILAANSLVVCCAPLWIPWVVRRLRSNRPVDRAAEDGGERSL